MDNIGSDAIMDVGNRNFTDDQIHWSRLVVAGRAIDATSTWEEAVETARDLLEALGLCSPRPQFRAP